MAAGNLRVVHLASYATAYSGSFIPMLEAARTGIESRGWTYEAVFPPGVERFGWYENMQAAGVRVRTSPEIGKRGAAGWTRDLLGERPGPTLLHTHFSAWDVPAAIAACPRRDTKVIWHLHSRLLEDAIPRARNAARFALLGRTVARILCVGPGIRAQAIARLAPAARTQVLPNGIDLHRFARVSAADRRTARERLGLPPDSRVLLTFAWDWETKGGPLFLDTVQTLNRRGRDVRAIIVGSEARSRREAERLHLDGAVHALPATESVRDLYGAADVFVAASVAEGTPFSVLEVLACGTPVVASDIAGHRFAAGGMQACRLTARTAPAFAEAIEAEFDSSAEARAERLDQTRAQIESEFSLTQWTRRLLSVYDDVAGRT
jgi:glycosyltransferase involved in cell wall biosynthesis